MARLIPMRILNQPVVKRIDIAGQEHTVTVVQRETVFIARSTLIAESGRSSVSAEDAVQRLLQAINENHSKQFEYMEPEKQRQLLTWIQLHLRKGTRGNTKRWSSHHLQPVVGHAIGFYISNGQLKGAMQAAGLAPTQDSAEYDPYWNFVLERNLRLWSLVWRKVIYKISNANTDPSLLSQRVNVPSISVPGYVNRETTGLLTIPRQGKEVFSPLYLPEIGQL